MRFCPQCAQPLEKRHIYGRLRPVCPRCGFIAFRDPKVAVGAVIAGAGGILLTRRAMDPGRGRWGLPAGYMEWDERAEDAAVREVREETGLEVRLERLVGVYSHPDRGVLLVIYAATLVGGTLRADPEECEAVGFFPPEHLPELAFPSTHDILADWRSLVDTLNREEDPNGRAADAG
jgi:ADP-ribose pyrophosphatase YjhB (NUDIX family)